MVNHEVSAEVPRVSAAYFEWFGPARPRAPMIIEGAVDDWPARRRWNAEYLAEKVGRDTPVVVRILDEKNVCAYRGTTETTFGEYLDAITADPPRERWYLTSADLQLPRPKGEEVSPFSRLLDDIALPCGLDPASVERTGVWVGYDGIASNLHYDLSDNFLVVLSGRKKLTLFGPSLTPYLYPNSLFSDDLIIHSQVDVEAPDLARFPKFAQAKPLRCTVEPGEILFLPEFFWHHVRSEGLSIAVNVWFRGPRDPFRLFRRPSRDAVLQAQLRDASQRLARLFSGRASG